MLMRGWAWLKSRDWRKLLVPLAILVVALVVGSTVFSPSYRNCTKQQQDQSSQEEQSNLLHEPGIVVYCEAVFAQENNGAITAIATIFVAIFTLTLWIVTGRSVQLAREEFLATHRPRIRVRAVGLDAKTTNAEQMAVKFTCINVGDARCQIVNVRYRFDGAEKADAPVYRMNMDTVELTNPRSIAAGDAEGFTTRTLSKVEAEKLGFEWDIYGFVQYVDDAGIKRITGFWRRYKPSTDTWRAPENPDYNYEY